MRNRSSIGIWQYWERIRRANGAPMRRDVDPCALRAILPDLFILERENDGGIRFRLAGTRICAGFGRELRGTRFADLWSALQRRRVHDQIEDAMRYEAPIASELIGISRSGQTIAMDVTALPMRSSGPASDRVIGSLSVNNPPQWFGSDPLVELSGAQFRKKDEGAFPSIPATDQSPIISATIVGASSPTRGKSSAKPFLLKILEGGRTR